MSSSDDVIYNVNVITTAYNLLATKYARFLVGDKVILASTPHITEGHAYFHAKHFLVKGALAIVAGVEVIPDSPTLWYNLLFDNESVESLTGEFIPVVNKTPYSFKEDMIDHINVSGASRLNNYVPVVPCYAFDIDKHGLLIIRAKSIEDALSKIQDQWNLTLSNCQFTVKLVKGLSI